MSDFSSVSNLFYLLYPFQKETIITDSATHSNWKQKTIIKKNVKIYSISPLINAWGYVINVVAKQDSIWQIFILEQMLAILKFKKY